MLMTLQGREPPHEKDTGHANLHVGNSACTRHWRRQTADRPTEQGMQ
jgi:hypothetical protein